jgi:hypothetical protein
VLIRVGAALGSAMGACVGDTVGTGSSGIGFGDVVGLADGNAVGANEMASTGCKVGGGMGAMDGTIETDGAVVFTTGDIVGVRVGDAVVILTLGADETSRVGMEDVVFKAGEIVGVSSTGAALGAGEVLGACI